MKTLILTTLFIVFTHVAFSQAAKDTVRLQGKNEVNAATNKIDSVNAGVKSNLDSITIQADNTTRGAVHKADSIRSGFQSKVDSLQLAYRKPVNELDSVSRALQNKINQAQSLKLPTTKLTTQLDSVNKVRTQKLSELNQKVNILKGKATASLKSLNLPPQMQGPVQKLEQSIQGYNIPMANGKIPSLNLSSAKIPGFQLPSGKLGAPSLGNTKLPGLGAGTSNPLNGITNETKEISNVTGQVSGYSKDVQNIAQGNMNEVKNLDKAAENQVMKTAAVGELKGKSAEMDKYKSQLAGRPDSAAMKMAKQQAITELQKEATNHFAGQEAVLKQAMSSMTKLKAKYSSVKSMADLPKKLPNPLHETPFIERLIPGVTFQIYNKGHILLDINPTAVYRISPRFSAGAGWVERTSFDKTYQPAPERVYGPRGIFQVKWKSGMSLRFLPELLNTFVPPQLLQTIATTEGQRQWVWSAFVGIKKEFKVFKNIKGNTEAMYNLYDPQSKSPYQDRLVVRFGFEFPMKKKGVGR